LSYRPVEKQRAKGKQKLLLSFCLLPFVSLTRFFVRGVLATETAEFSKFDASSVLLFIFRHRIIAALAIAAFEGNDFTHSLLTFFAMIY